MSIEKLHFLSVSAADFNPRIERTFNNTIIAFDIPSYKVEQLQSKIIKIIADESKKLAPSLKTIGFTHPVYTLNTDHRDFQDQRSNIRFVPNYNGPKEIPSSLKNKMMDKAQLLKWVTKKLEESVKDIKKAATPDQMSAREVTIDHKNFQIKAKYSAYQMIFQIIPRGLKSAVLIQEFMPKTITNVPIIKVGPERSLMYKTDAIGPQFLDKVSQIVDAIIEASRHGGRKLLDVSSFLMEGSFNYELASNGMVHSFEVEAASLEEAESKFRGMSKAWNSGDVTLRISDS